MAKIPFSIDYKPQIESGEYKVIDQFGYVLTLKDIINDAWYFSLRYPNTDYETERIYDHPENHLFVATPGPELSEFEERIFKLLRQHKECDIPLTPENIKAEASMLWQDFEKYFFYLYGKEGEGDSALRSFYYRGLEDGKAEALKDIEQDPESSYAFKRGVEYGKEEALKDLPMWRYKKGGTGPILHDCLVLNKYGCISKSPSGALLGDVWTLEYDELTKLPKLPKED